MEHDADVLAPETDVDILVQSVRQKSRASIVKQCGTMQVLDMTHPIGLDDIYTSVNVLESITGQRQMEIAQLLQVCEPALFNRYGLGKIVEERIPGAQAVNKHSKLLVFGKPGAGKTTFLKYLAIQCSLGKFRADEVVVFITLKNFAEAENQPNLYQYITQLLSLCGVTETETSTLLKHGRVMILLDGLDEIQAKDISRSLSQIREFSSQFTQNRFVLTCRIAASEYTFSQFTEVEVADFDQQQIDTFAIKWFSANPALGNKFLQKLRENEPIQELANNPLLLTLLCLVFEESAEFPRSRPQIYQDGLTLLLKKWDAKKSIERQLYKNLSVYQKEYLLSKIALTTFEQGEYFFLQEVVEQHIADYLCNLPDINTQVELQNDSRIVLKSIEAQHGLLVERARGIYSFSHLTFHEYFAAREIVSTSEPEALKTALQQLVSRITEKRWREVFLLSAGILRNADYLLKLMKQKLELIVASDDLLQALLAWVNQKSCHINTPFKLAAVRAFYFTLAYTLILASGEDKDRTLAFSGDAAQQTAFNLDNTFALNATAANDLNIDRALVLVLARAVDFQHGYNLDTSFQYFITFTRALVPGLSGIAKRSQLSELLLTLKNQLPATNESETAAREWWQKHGEAWTQQLREMMISQRDIGHDWQLSVQQRETLKQYYDANRLLAQCLNSDCYLTRAVREQLEESLFLPVAKIN